MKPTWLNNFKQQLAHDQLSCKLQVKPLYLKRIRQDTPNNSALANIASETHQTETIDAYQETFAQYGQELTGLTAPATNTSYYLFDFAKYAASKATSGYVSEIYANTPQIDGLLIDFYKFYQRQKHEDITIKYHNALIVSNKFLQEQHANYHVVILNATNDFVLNYYPKIDFNTHLKTANPTEQFYDTLYDSMQSYIISTKIDPTFHEQYIRPTLECLLFLDQDNQCFLALPANGFYLDQSDDQLPVLPVTVTQIANILAQFPVAQMRDFYPALINRQGFNQNKEADETANYLAGYNTNQSNYFADSPKIAANGLTLKRKRYLKYFEYDLCMAHNQEIKDYLTKHLSVTCDQKGDLKSSIKPTNKLWQKRLETYQTNHFPYLANGTVMSHQNETQANYELAVLYRKYNNLPAILGQKSSANTKNKLKPTKISQVALDKTLTAKLKPLVNKQMGQVFAKLQPGNQHQYYYTKHQLYTLNGKEQVDRIEQVILNDQQGKITNSTQTIQADLLPLHPKF